MNTDDILPKEEELLNVKDYHKGQGNGNGTGRRPKHLQKFGFPIIALVFFIGSLTFAVGLAYNNLARSFIEQYPFGKSVYGSLINFVVIVTGALLVIWLIWKKYPTIVETKLI